MNVKSKIKQTRQLHVRKRFENGGMLLVMNGLNKESSDYNDIMVIGRWFAEMGNNVHVLRTIHYKNPDYQKYFGPLVGSEYFRKCPDLKIGEKYFEYEGFVGTWSKKKLSRMLSHGAKQSPYLIIKNTKGCSDRFILRSIGDRLNDRNFHHSIKEVWVFEKGAVRLLYKA
jgi:hypothetical protein